MHVGIDISNAVDPRPTGISRYIRCLVDGLTVLPEAPRLTLYCRISRRRRGNPALIFPDHRVRWLTGLLAPRGVDVFHATDLRAPRRLSCPLVVTIHDLSALDRDDHARPEFIEKKRKQLAEAALRATGIITQTEAVRAEIIERLGAAPKRVRAIPLADPLPLTDNSDQDRAREPFLLIVGGPSRRKGCARMKPLLALLRERLGWSPPVTWVGSAPLAEGRAMLEQLGIDGGCFYGHISDADLHDLYRRACGLLVLSESEGFCMPLLEAARRGCPVLALESPPLREVLRDTAFWFREPLAQSTSVFEDFTDAALRASRARDAAARAEEFSWERTAHLTHECYREMVS